MTMPHVLAGWLAMVEAAVGLQDVMIVARATKSKAKEMHNRELELISKKKIVGGTYGGGAAPPCTPPTVYIVLLGPRPFLKAFRHFAESGFLNDTRFLNAGSLL